MRARYTAFVTANLRFLLNTLHPEYRKPGDRRSLKNSFRETKWLGLSIISTERGQEQDSDGIVEFVATFVENQQIAEHHERSSFIKEHGNWYYQTALEMKAR